MEKIEKEIQVIHKSVRVVSLLNTTVWDISDGQLRRESVIHDVERSPRGIDEIKALIASSGQQLSSFINADVSRMYMLITLW